MCDVERAFDATKTAMFYYNRLTKTVYEACYGGKKELRILVDRYFTRLLYTGLFATQSYAAEVLAQPEFTHSFASYHAHERDLLEDAFDDQYSFDDDATP